jgi:hypothetical protein
MGRGNRQTSGAPSTSAGEGLGLETYAQYGIITETISTVVPDERYTESDLSDAAKTARRIEVLASDSAGLRSLHRLDFPEKDLRCTEALFTELGESMIGGDDIIAERLDPDGMLGMSDATHLYAIASLIRDIREGRPPGAYLQMRQEHAESVLAARSQIQQ